MSTEPLSVPLVVTMRLACEEYRRDIKCGNGDDDVDFGALPAQERESRVAEAEMNALFVAGALVAAGWKPV